MIDNIILRIVTTKFDSASSKLLVHKVIIIKEVLQQSQVSHKLTKNNRLYNLMAATLNKNYAEIFQIEDQTLLQGSEGNLYSKQFLHKFSINYLLKMIAKKPHDKFLQLFTGYYYAKKIKFYGFCFRILSELRESGSYLHATNAALVIGELQDRLIHDYKTDSNALDLSSYTHHVSSFAKLKLKMVAQAENQEKLFTEMISDKPDFENMLSYAHEASKLRRSNERLLKNLLQTIPDHYIDPLIICAHYQLKLNNSSESFAHFSKLYDQKQKKYEKFKHESLCEQNLYFRDTLAIFISAEAKSSSVITYFSLSAQRSHGKDFTNQKVGSVVIPPLFGFYSEMFKSMAEQGDIGLLKQIGSSVTYNSSKGTIFLANYFLNIHPFLGRGLQYLDVYWSNPGKEVLILSERGQIDYFSEGFGNQFGLFSLRAQNKKVTVGQLCPELKSVNQAFNVKAYPEKYTNEVFPSEKSISNVKAKEGEDSQYSEQPYFQRVSDHSQSYIRLNEAQVEELYNQFRGEGKTLTLTVPSENKLESLKRKSYQYHCKFENMVFGNLNLKMVILEEADTRSEELSISTKEFPQLEKADTWDESKQVLDFDEQVDNKSDVKETWQSHRLTQKFKNFPGSPVGSEEPTSPDFVFPTSTRNLMSPKASERETGVLVKLDTMKSKFIFPSPNRKALRHQATVSENALQVVGDNSSERSRMSGKKTKLTKIYQQIVSSKYSSPKDKYILTFFALAFIGLLANHNYFQASVRSGSHTMTNLKDAAVLLQAMSYCVIMFIPKLRMLWEYSTGSFDEADYPESFSIEVLSGDFLTQVEQLVQATKDYQEALKLVDPKYQASSFDDVIRFYDSDGNFMNISVLQTMDRFIASSYHALNLTKTDFPAAASAYDPILRNALNDLVLQGFVIVEDFMSNLMEIQDSADVMKYVDRTDTIAGLAGSLIVFILITYKQAKKEKQLMLALVKLPVSELSKNLQKTTQFKRDILEDADFGSFDKNQLAEDNRSSLQVKKQQGASLRNNNSYSDYLFTRTYLKYYMNIFKMFLLLMIYVAKFLFLSLSAINFTHLMLIQVSSLSFLKSIQAHLAVSYAVSFEVLAENGATIALNNASNVALANIQADNKDMRNSITEMYFSEGVRGLDGIFFDDACKYVDTDLIETCQKAKDGAEKITFIELWTKYEDSQTEIFQQYRDSDKSSTTLHGLLVRMIDEFIPTILTLINLSKTANNLVKEDYSELLTSQLLRNIIATWLGTAIVVGVGVSVVLYVRKKLRERETEFRKILQTLPTNLVFSNFVLKSHLIKTSNGALDSIKNHL